ncbi:MAG TPA: hypothetical protein VF988_04080 [Verrucomicrobiae bacterium]
MKTLFQKTQIWAALTVLAGWTCTAMAQDDDLDLGDSPAVEVSSVLTIHADGSSAWASTMTEPRAAAEQQVRLRERYANQTDSDTDDNPPSEVTSTNESKPFTDEELSKKYLAMLDDQNDQSDLTNTIEVKTNAIVLRSSRSFPSLEDMLKNSYVFLRAGGFAFANARFETDTNGLLRVTFSPQAGMERYVKSFRSRWKLSGGKSEIKLVMPGKVVASDFPATEANATWLTVDAKKDESMDAAAKFYTTPAVITAEAGGLKLAQPLEFKKLWREKRAADDEALPLAEAGQGFLAEAQSITTTTLHVFPGGEDYYKNNNVSTGAVVNAKLFAPKGRTLKSVSGVRVLSAVDNQGRSVVAASTEDDTANGFYGSYGSTFSDSSEEGNSLPVELHLQLPQPDAQSIDKISAEAEAISAGSWKEFTCTNLQANATNEFDLSPLLPGAKMVVTKAAFKNGQLSAMARLRGPAAIKRLEVRAKIPGRENFNNYSSERQSGKKDQEFTRTLMLQGFGFGGEEALSLDAVTLVVRYPQDLKREHVTFELKSLDLF